MDVVTLGAALNGSKKYTDARIAPLLGGVHYRGSVNYVSNLPTDPEEGDAYTVKYKGTSGTDPDGAEYVWGLDTDDNTYKWIVFAGDTYTKTEVDALLSGKQDTISDLATIRSNASAGAGAAELVTGINSTANNYIEMKSGQREYLSLTVPTGNIPIGSVGMGFDDGVYTYKLGTKVSDGEPTANLFDRTGEQVGYYFINSSGDVSSGTSAAGWSASDYIKIKENTQYTFKPTDTTVGSSAKHCFYNEQKQALTSYIIPSGQQTFTTPQGAMYARFSYKGTSSNNMLNEGSNPLPYEPYGKRKISFYANGQALADYTIYGNDGGVGDEVTDSESAHYGEYDIPVICGNTTTHIYLASPLGANDSIDYTTTQVAIPTTDGENTLICDTGVQPSKVSLTYTGWHSDLDGLQTEITSTNKLSADLVDDTSTTNKFVTAAEKTTISKAVTTDDIGLGTDYFIYNGIRVYVSATEPTGTIPDGSIWFGSGAAGVGIFTVTVTADSQDNLTSDKTYSEIMAAYTANQLIFVNWVNNRSSYTLASTDRIPLSEINNNQMFNFTRSYVGDGEIVVMTISIRDSTIAPIVVTNETVSTV